MSNRNNLKNLKKQKSRSYDSTSIEIPGFLFKTYKILEDPLNNEIISWSEDGNAFIVKKVNEFTELILPKYFKHKNYSSFVRQVQCHQIIYQLNMYDFHKTRKESTENEFRHRLFKRGYQNLLSQIKRKIPESQDQLAIYPQNAVYAQQHLQNSGQLNNHDTQFIMEEMIALRNKQEDLDSVCQILLNQNNKLLGENRLLWQQMMRNKSKNERKLEKIILWIVNHIINDSAVENNTTFDLMSEADAQENPLKKNCLQDRIDKLHMSNKQNDKAKSLLKLVQMLKTQDSKKQKIRQFDLEDENLQGFKALKTKEDQSNGNSTNRMFDDPQIDQPVWNQLAITNEEVIQSPQMQFDTNYELLQRENSQIHDFQDWGSDQKLLQDQSLDQLFQ